MKWHKRGLVYRPRGDLWWAKKYALLPTASVSDDQVIRVYFASLDEELYGRIGYVEVDVDSPQQILYESQGAVLDIGELGTFDDCGVNPSSVMKFGGRMYLYYIGWQRCERVPYMLFSGVAISADNGRSFKKHSRTPILERNNDEPFSRSAPWVTVEGDILKMWYWSCVRWTYGKSGVHYNSVLRYATSKNGIEWSTHDHVCIQPEGNDEYAVGRPCVVKDGHVYRMWYSIRSFNKLYTIGYAESNDGIHWVRKDNEAGIDKSESGWDSEMICYPCVVDIKGKRYMFYNGNRHGASGFGYAILE
ncbi:MAG: hypothetical protein ACE5FE_00065 [Acidiferrobacterales bacterium]